jgi:hypothetical protein
MLIFTDSALPLKHRFRVRLLGVTSKTLMSTFTLLGVVSTISKESVQQSEKANHQDGANDSSSLKGKLISYKPTLHELVLPYFYSTLLLLLNYTILLYITTTLF